MRLTSMQQLANLVVANYTGLHVNTSGKRYISWRQFDIFAWQW